MVPVMRRTTGASNEHVIRNRGWRGIASAIGLLLTVLLLASCGSSGEPSADGASESQPAPAVPRIAEPDPDCGPAPTSLSAAMAIDTDRPDCLYTAPVTLTADVPGKINFLISPPPVTCAVDVLNRDGSTNSSFSLDSTDNDSAWVLDTGEGMTLSDKDGGTCRFQVGWTPSAAPASTTTTTTATPTTTSTTTTTTTTTTSTTTTTAPPPTTTSNVGS